MRQREERAHWSGLAWIAFVGLNLACFIAPVPVCRAHALDHRTIHDPSQAAGRICNPAPEATLEDMKLAVAVLEDTTEIANWRNVAWYLGELGFPGCFEPLRDFVWGTHGHGDPMRYMPGALHSAQASLGPVAASCPEALQYLIGSSAPSYWESLPWRDPRRTRSELCIAMSEASIEALGNSGAPEAGQMLARLRQWPYAEAQRVTIEKALRMYRRVTLERRYRGTDVRWSSLYHLPEIMPPNRNEATLPGSREGVTEAVNSGSVSLLGAWRWMRSAGGSGAYQTPPACGWSRVLFIERDSTYSFWEEDSVGDYRICSGRFVLHTFGSQPKEPWVELRGWWEGPGTFWLQFMGPDLLTLRPGSAQGVWHDLGLRHTFARDKQRAAAPDTIGAKEWRPPRARRATATSYCIEVPNALEGVLKGTQLHQWNLGHWLVPKGYEYTHYQIPSGVVGDFDGDSLADAAVYGYDGDGRNTVACLLSNRGSPEVIPAWVDPVAARRKGGPSGPSFYLKLCPSGRVVTDSNGARIVLATDGVCTISSAGEEWILYYANSQFHRGKPAPGVTDR